MNSLPTQTPIDHQASTQGSSLRGRKNLVWVILLILSLGLTFWLYAKPDVVIMLAEQMWACF